MSIFKKKVDPVAIEREKIALQREALERGSADSETIQVNQKDREDLLRWQQDLRDDLENLKHDLRREFFDISGNCWRPMTFFVGKNDAGADIYQELPPLLNELGINMIEGVVRPFLSRNLINANLDDQMVYGMLRRSSDTLVNNLAYYGDVFELEFGNYDVVVRMTKNVIIPAPFRALMGWTKKTDSTVSKRLESHSDGIKPMRDGGWFGFMKS